MAPVPASVVRQAEQLRIRGNECYKKGRIGAAIDAYTERGSMLDKPGIVFSKKKGVE